MHTIFNQGENETYMEPFQLFITYLIVKIIKLSITHSTTQSSVTLESVREISGKSGNKNFTSLMLNNFAFERNGLRMAYHT